MQHVVNITIPLSEYNEKIDFSIPISKNLGINSSRIRYFRILKKSIDSRHNSIRFHYQFQVFVDEDFTKPKIIEYSDVSNKPEVLIIGSGPAGLFAALRLIELGLKPIIIERGKPVSERKNDVAILCRQHIVNPESNYCFGEGGAGTFSDGKLYSRSNKRGDIQKILQILHNHGANESILYDSHPHIGTDILPMVIKNIRNTIINHGGKFYFSKRFKSLLINNDTIEGIELYTGGKIYANSVIIATGHSARDVFYSLNQQNVALEFKPFAVGVRVEHPQELISHIQYHGIKHDLLPAASYSLVSNIKGRGVFSFCMCPGGFIVPSATMPEQVVVNGMSSSKRNSPFANSGIVVSININDIPEFKESGVFAGLKFQEKIENLAWNMADKTQKAPAQRLSDFLNGICSQSLPQSSYFPGIISSPIHKWLPLNLYDPLKHAFIDFDRKMHGFITNEAIVTAVESRTSSPIRILRDSQSYMSVSVKGLFPCGEGAGYAGGITSSAIDGENCANMVFNYYNYCK